MTRPPATLPTEPTPHLVHPPDRPTRLPPGETNAVGWTLGLIGDEWNLLILRYAMLGVRRYGQWRQELPISHAVLTRRLAVLTETGMGAILRRPEGCEANGSREQPCEQAKEIDHSPT